ncbi:transglutaminase-like domain-containing protein [Saccharothrix obliqua]|uniref:transglutaminase-like domain-containing protein n=1 Tax=Saccharothrix obliqua TaxID=2861747 RepID=UPI002150A49B|nr:transglutaminase-like domain-containing protein [Saccharothrix obliqua]
MSTEATDFLDHGSPVVREFVRRAVPDESAPDLEKARALYYAVRDGIQYEIQGADVSRAGLRASSIIQRNMGFCVHKSVVYAAALRSVGIPARLFYGDVRNHITNPKLERLIGGDVFTYHGLTTVFLEGRWVKVTPVFNKLLCKLYKITPLEFDGRADSVYHPYDETGQRHMEFVREHGDFDDVPYDTILNGIRANHPLLFETWNRLAGGSLVADAQR